MTIVGEILAAIKSIGVIAEQLGRIADGIHKMKDGVSDARYEKLKKEIDQVAVDLESASTKEETRAALRRLADARRRNV